MKGANALYLYMDGCPHCEKMNPIWDDIANSMQDIKFTKIESKDSKINQYKKLPGFDGFPFFAFFVPGKKPRYVAGSRPDKATLVKELFGTQGGRRTRNRTRRLTRRRRSKF